MLDTIIIGLLILSALVYGFWQYLAKPDDARDKRKSKPATSLPRLCPFLASTRSHAAHSDAKLSHSTMLLHASQRRFFSFLFYGSRSPRMRARRDRIYRGLPCIFDCSSSRGRDSWRILPRKLTIAFRWTA